MLLLVCVVAVAVANAQENKSGSMVKFKKHTVSAAFVSEGVAVGDVNKDGASDIVAGNYWFEAPTWNKHLLHADTLRPVPGYSTSFINFCTDVNKDGWPDVVRFDEPGGKCAWYENPKRKQRLWQGRTILPHAGNETPLLVDVDGDGALDLLCNDAAAKRMIWLKSPAKAGDTTWKRFTISRDSLKGTNRYTHGLGWGDVNKDGRNDVVIKSGWWEAPAIATTEDWTFHPAAFGEDASNMYVRDVDNDGDQDIISSSAHKYGLWWHEQVKESNGKYTWTTHEISKLFSQSHALMLKDINGDRKPDLITGKRYLAHHDGSDPGSFDPAVLYWYEFVPGKKPRWIPHQVDDNSGVGNNFVVTDLNGDKKPDIIVSNKKGVYYFEQVQ